MFLQLKTVLFYMTFLKTSLWKVCEVYAKTEKCMILFLYRHCRSPWYPDSSFRDKILSPYSSRLNFRALVQSERITFRAVEQFCFLSELLFLSALKLILSLGILGIVSYSNDRLQQKLSHSREIVASFDSFIYDTDSGYA